MPWESGPRGRPDFTRTRRENGRVVPESVDVGRQGRRAADEDEARRRQAEARRARPVTRQGHPALDPPAELLARAALLVAA
jgi:hypothetical protein